MLPTWVIDYYTLRLYKVNTGKSLVNSCSLRSQKCMKITIMLNKVFFSVTVTVGSDHQWKVFLACNVHQRVKSNHLTLRMTKQVWAGLSASLRQLHIPKENLIQMFKRKFKFYVLCDKWRYHITKIMSPYELGLQYELVYAIVFRFLCCWRWTRLSSMTTFFYVPTHYIYNSQREFN